jgi:hypothetical protein
MKSFFFTKWFKKSFPCAIFISVDFSIETVRSLNPNDFSEVVKLFKLVLPFDDSELSLASRYYEDHFEGDLHGFIVKCLQRRGLITYIMVWPFQTNKDPAELISGLRYQKWVKGTKSFCDSELIDLYRLILNGIRQQIMMGYNIPESAKMWRMITLTLGPRSPYKYDPTEPINLATLQAAKEGITIIVSAGNEAQFIKGNSMNPWAVAPWVIGVGATNAIGTKLLKSSSVGTEEDGNGPAIVAPGEADTWASIFGHVHIVAIRNLEIAPPNTVKMVVDGSDVYNYHKEPDGKITIQQVFGINKFGKKITLDELEKLVQQKKGNLKKIEKGTSFSAEYVGAICEHIALRIKNIQPNIPIEMRSKFIKTILEDMAEPIEGYHKWEQGSGLVTWEIAEEYLKNLDEKKIYRLSERANTLW